MDEVQIKAVNLANGKNLPELPTLMFEFIGTGEKMLFEYYFVSTYFLLASGSTSYFLLPKAQRLRPGYGINDKE